MHRGQNLGLGGKMTQVCAVVIGADTNNTTVQICRDLIFKYGIRMVCVGSTDLEDRLLYGLECYYQSDSIRRDSWMYTFDSQIDLINERRQLYQFAPLHGVNWNNVLVDASVVLNLTQFYEPTLGGLLSTPVEELEHTIREWCHVISTMERIRSHTTCSMVFLVNPEADFNRGRAVLSNSTIQFVDGKLATGQDLYEVCVSVKQLFHRFENGTYANIMR